MQVSLIKIKRWTLKQSPSVNLGMVFYYDRVAIGYTKQCYLFIDLLGGPDREPNIFPSSPANLVNKHFITWSLSVEIYKTFFFFQIKQDVLVYKRRALLVQYKDSNVNNFPFFRHYKALTIEDTLYEWYLIFSIAVYLFAFVSKQTRVFKTIFSNDSIFVKKRKQNTKKNNY